MERHYVKVVNGKIIDGPRIISANHSDSPNTQWQPDQMRRWDYFEVDLSCDQDTEYVDTANPTITTDSVTYPRIQKDPALVLSDLKQNLIKRERANLWARIAQRYEDREILLIALLGGGVSIKSEIQSLVNAWQDYKVNVNASTTPQEARSCVVVWP